MIIGIYDDKRKDGDYYLALRESSDSFALGAVDGDGGWTNTILRIGRGHRPYITLNTDVSDKLGLELDEDGRVVIKKEG